LGASSLAPIGPIGGEGGVRGKLSTRTALAVVRARSSPAATGAVCKANDLDNLYVVDGSFLMSSAAVNPTLTIIANALRVGEHLAGRLGGSVLARQPAQVEPDLSAPPANSCSRNEQVLTFAC